MRCCLNYLGEYWHSLFPNFPKYTIKRRHTYANTKLYAAYTPPMVRSLNSSRLGIYFVKYIYSKLNRNYGSKNSRIGFHNDYFGGKVFLIYTLSHINKMQYDMQYIASGIPGSRATVHTSIFIKEYNFLSQIIFIF